METQLSNANGTPSGAMTTTTAIATMVWFTYMPGDSERLSSDPFSITLGQL
jgi:hypothetical protein